MNSKYIYPLIYLFVACKTKEKVEVPQPQIEKHQIASVPIEEKPSLSSNYGFDEFFINFSQIISSQNIPSFMNLLDSSVTCGGEDESGIIGCSNRFPIKSPSSENSQFFKKLGELVKYGYEVELSENDTISFVPSYYSRKTIPPCEIEKISNCHYIPEKEFKLFKSQDSSSKYETLAGKIFVTEIEKIGCQTYGFLTTEADCEWQKISIDNGKVGWVNNYQAKWIYGLSLMFKKNQGKWKIILINDRYD